MQSHICILVSIFKLFCVCSVSKNVCNWIHTLGNLMINWHQMLACHIQKFHKPQHEEGTCSEAAKQWCPPTQILTYTSSYKNSQPFDKYYFKSQLQNSVAVSAHLVRLWGPYLFPQQTTQLSLDYEIQVHDRMPVIHFYSPVTSCALFQIHIHKTESLTSPWYNTRWTTQVAKL